MKEPLRIGMIGCGTVGTGVLELLHRRAGEFAGLLGRDLRVVRIVVRDLSRSRPQIAEFASPPPELSDTPANVTGADDVDLVVEVAGGVDAPRDWIVDALRNGHDVVTANKATLAFHGREIFGTAQETGRHVFYEASVAAAIPIIESLESALVANQIGQIHAILNGTCNYILTQMEREQKDYADALREAQEKGFAEADPALDVGGDDTAHKLALLGSLITRSFVDADSVYTDGITAITRDDIAFGEQMGYRIKLLAIARRGADDAWEFRVHPTMISRSEVIAEVSDEFNAVHVQGDAVGPMLLYGKGAGSLPTASSVVADIVRAAKGDSRFALSPDLREIKRIEIDEIELRHYVRMTVLDRPGVLGRITSVLGECGISIASIHQPEAKTDHPVPVVLVTHETKEEVIAQSLEELHRAGLLTEPATRIRIEEFA